MELLELKNIWKIVEKKEIKKNQINEHMITNTIQRRSDLILSKLARAMRLQTIMAGIAGFFALLVSPMFIIDKEDGFLLDHIFSPIEMSIVLFSMAVIVLFVTYYNWKGHQQIITYQKNSKNLKESLSDSLSILNKVQNLKIYSDAFGVPFFGIWIVYATLYSEYGFQLDIRLVYLLLIAVSIFVIGYYFAKWANRPYKQYIEKLQYFQNELEAGDPLSAKV